MIAIRKLLVVFANTLAHGCFSSQCEKMGYGPEGSAENERCAFLLRQNFANRLQQASNNLGTPYNNRYALTINQY